MEKTNNTINTQNNAKETIDTSTVQGEYYDNELLDIIKNVDMTNPDCVLLVRLLAGSNHMFNVTCDQRDGLTKEKNILEKRIDILHNRLAEVAKNFLYEQVQDVIYKTHEEQDFRESIETDYVKVSDLGHTLDDDQKELLSDIMHGLGVSTGMLLSEVFKAGIKACNTHGETLESLNNLETVDVSRVFYDALPTNRY